MEIGRLKGILAAEIDDAIGMLDTETTEQRATALNYYLRNPYGNEVEGRSQIVTGEVAEVIDGALPQLIRIFTAGDEIVRYEPVIVQVSGRYRQVGAGSWPGGDLRGHRTWQNNHAVRVGAPCIGADQWRRIDICAAGRGKTDAGERCRVRY